jgi:hypothetical protein
VRVRAITVAVVLLLVAATPRVVASGPRLPANDPFYRYSGSTPLKRIAPGTVLKHRTVRLALAPGLTTPVDAEQLLYRTTGQRGEPTVTVTTVLVPTPTSVPASALANIVEYLSFYDGLGSQCDPSFTLAGGDSGDATYQQEAQEEALLIAWYLSQGDIVTVPDFEGTGLHWMAGRESGYAALDAIKATQAYLRLEPATTKVGLSGYSGGSVAADWASELAPAYAPDLDIVGVAEGGIPADYLHHLAYIDGTDEYSAAIPGELLGLSRAYGIDLTKYLSPYGRTVVDEISDVCIASAFGRYPGLTIASIMRPEYADLAHAEPFAAVLRAQTMGTARTHPRAPLFMAVGNVDGIGDGAMVAADVEALARRYCAQGVAVLYQEYPGASHIQAAAYFEPQTGPFLQARFAGLPFVSNCGR